MSDPDWGRWARQARQRGADCPDDETLRSWIERKPEEGSAANPSSGRVGAHVKECPRCALQMDELRAFFADEPSGAGSEPAEVERIQSLLRRTLQSPFPDARRSPVSGLPVPPRGRAGAVALRRAAPWLTAAAAVLVVGVALGLFVPGSRDGGPPPIPDLDAGSGVLRGVGRPHLLEPEGELREVPRRFVWEATVETPTRWLFSLERVDGTIIWSIETVEPSVTLADSVARELHRGSRYVWKVRHAQDTAPGATGSFQIAP